MSRDGWGAKPGSAEAEKTFELTLVPESLFMAAVECGLTDPQLHILRGVEETIFFTRNAQVVEA
jgi:hypothetical protein